MVEGDRPQGWQIGVILVSGILAISTAAILVRLATHSAQLQGVGFSLVLAAARLMLAAGLLLPNWPSLVRTQPTVRSLIYSMAAGVALALHFSTWITSLSYTSIVASTTLVTTNPIWVALLSWGWFGESPSRLTLLGIGTALSGSLVVGFGDGGDTISRNPLLGNGLALVGSWMVSAYFLLGRAAQRQGLSLSHYITVAYSTAALLLLPMPLLLGHAYDGYPVEVYGYMLLMAIVPQLIGHTSLNWAMCWFSPTLVTLTILLEPVLASLWGYVLFQEVPPWSVGLGAIVVLLGVALAVMGNRKTA